MQILLLLTPVLLGVVGATYDPYVDMARLYRMQLLANAFDGYIPDEQMLTDGSLDESQAEAYWPELAERFDDDPRRAEAADDVIYNDDLYSGAHLRDQEHLEHSDLHGYQSVSGGTAEGAPNAKQVKSDKALPAYCNPPNPCPVGKTSKDNCVENFENSASNNKQLLSEQKCPCDTEHMFVCAAGSETVSSKGQSPEQQMVLSKVMSQMENRDDLGEDQFNNPYLTTNSKRMKLVAKKSPHMIKKRALESYGTNPYMKGAQKRMVAKKSGEVSKNYLFQWLDNLPEASEA